VNETLQIFIQKIRAMASAMPQRMGKKQKKAYSVFETLPRGVFAITLITSKRT
jgi:hypothetical protein